MQGKEEGKFVDQVAAKNEGASYLAVYVWTRRSFVQYLVHHKYFFTWYTTAATAVRQHD